MTYSFYVDRTRYISERVVFDLISIMKVLIGEGVIGNIASHQQL